MKEKIFEILQEDYESFHADCEAQGPNRTMSHCCYCGPRWGLEPNEIIIDCSSGRNYISEKWVKDNVIVYYLWTPGIWTWYPDETLKKLGFQLVEVIE